MRTFSIFIETERLPTHEEFLKQEINFRKNHEQVHSRILPSLF
jgi:hypothetical protein